MSLKQKGHCDLKESLNRFKIQVPVVYTCIHSKNAYSKFDERVTGMYFYVGLYPRICNQCSTLTPSCLL